jgi:predicted nucleic acid-binding protein
MKVVVTDACIFIDVIELQLTSKFFSLNLEIHTTQDVLNELYSSQYQILEGYKASKKLEVHNLTGEEQLKLLAEEYPNSLTPEDRSVIFVAEKLKATVLSSDKEVRKYAKKLSIDYHGMLWIFDALVEGEIITKGEVISKISQMGSSNIMYSNSQELQAEIQKRVTKWSK